jgi:hypothetical protein
MRTLVPIVLLVISVSVLKAQQQSVAIGIETTNSKAVLLLHSAGKNQGLIVPIVSNLTLVNAGATEKGMIVFNESDSKLYYYNDNINNGKQGWVEVAPSGPGSGTEADGIVGNEITSVIADRGLEVSGSGTITQPLTVGLIPGTANGQVLKWNDVTKKWELSAISSGATYTAFQGLVINSTSQIGVNNGAGLIIDGAGKLAVDAGTAANKIVQLDGTGKLPVSVLPATVDLSNTNEIQDLSITSAGNGTAAPGETFTINNSSAPGTGVTLTEGLNISITRSANTLTINGVPGGTGTVTNVSGTSPISVATPTTTPLISITQANTTTNGFLSSVDWNTFNTKIGPTTSAAGDVTGTFSTLQLGNTAPTGNRIITAINAGSGSVNGIRINPSFGAQNISTTGNVNIRNVNYVWPNGNGTGTLANDGAGNLSWVAAGSTSLDNLSDVAIAAPAGGQILVNNGSGNFVNTAVSGDIALTNTGSAAIQNSGTTGNNIVNAINNAGTTQTIGTGRLNAAVVLDTESPTSGDLTGAYSNLTITNNAVTSAKIADGTIAAADLATNIAIATTGTISSGAIATPDIDINGVAYTWPGAPLPAGTNFLSTTNTGTLSWGPVPSAFSTNNVLPKGDGTTLMSSNISDNGTLVTVNSGTTINGATSIINTAANAANTGVTISTSNGTGTNTAINASATGGSTESVGIISNASGIAGFATGVRATGTGAPVNVGVEAITTGPAGSDNAAVWAKSTTVGAARNYGVIGNANDGTVINYGVQGNASGSGTSNNYGVYARATGLNEVYGIYANGTGGPNPWAGYFEGNTAITQGLAVGNSNSFGNSGEVLTSQGTGAAPVWTPLPTGFSSTNVIPKGNGTGMTGSSMSDDGSTVSVSTNSSIAPSIQIFNNGGGVGLSGRGVMSIGAAGSGSETLYGLALGLTGTGTGQYNGIFSFVTGTASSWNRGIVAGAQNSSQNIGVDSYADANTGTNFTYRANLSGTQALPKYGLYINASGAGTKYGIYSVGENTNYFSGTVGIGQISPATQLHVVHTNGLLTNGITLENASTGPPAVAWKFYVASAGDLWTAIGNSQRGSFNFTSGAYASVSDRRQKKDFEPMVSMLPKVLQLEPLFYHFNSQGSADQKHMGFIAQDVKSLFPSLVNYSSENDLYTLDYSGFGVLAIKAIQEQQKEIEILKQEVSEIDALKKEIEALRAAVQELKKN